MEARRRPPDPPASLTWKQAPDGKTGIIGSHQTSVVSADLTGLVRTPRESRRIEASGWRRTGADATRAFSCNASPKSSGHAERSHSFSERMHPGPRNSIMTELGELGPVETSSRYGQPMMNTYE